MCRAKQIKTSNYPPSNIQINSSSVWILKCKIKILCYPIGHTDISALGVVLWTISPSSAALREWQPGSLRPDPLQPGCLPTASTGHQELQEWPTISPYNPWDDRKDTTVNTEMGKGVVQLRNINMKPFVSVFRSWVSADVSVAVKLFTGARRHCLNN